MSKYKLVSVEPIRRAIDTLERFANDTLAGRNSAHELRELLAAAPDVQGEPVAWMTSARVFGEGFTTGRRQAEKWMKSYPSKTIPLYSAPQPAEQRPDVAQLVEALDAAARSLETIGSQAGIDEYMCEFGEVRGYAKNRAAVAREALAAHRKKGGSND